MNQMGYGSQALSLLLKYFQGDIVGSAAAKQSLVEEESSEEEEEVEEEESEEDEDEESKESNDDSDEETKRRPSTALQRESVKPRKKLPPLLQPLVDRPAERLHWIGVSFGLTAVGCLHPRSQILVLTLSLVVCRTY